MVDKFDHLVSSMNRRVFMKNSMYSLGSAALASLFGGNSIESLMGNNLGLPHFTPKVKRVIYLFQSGAPSQLELFDHKPKLKEMFGQELPASIRGNQRVTGMTSNQKSFPIAMGDFNFGQYGQSGAWISDIMPHHHKIADELCFIKTMHTEAINHDPAVTFVQTGSQQAGRPSIGSWLSYGLGSENDNLPTFVVLLSRGVPGGQPLYAKLWGNGFLPSQHQGVMFRSGDDPVLYLKDPQGVDRDSRRIMLDYLEKMHQNQFEKTKDDRINAKIAQYEMAFRMQMSVPETLDLSQEPSYIFDQYGPDSRTPGTFAYNCILARKLAENGVRFVQLYQMGWDFHGNLPNQIRAITKTVDQPSAALIKDLKQRGMLEDTLVIWGGEFGRGAYSQGKLSKENYGRDHHPRCFTIWMAGAGVKKGITFGQTDDFGYNVVSDPVHVHDFQATLLHLMGIDHERFTYKFQGRRYRLTDVQGTVVKDILS